MTDLTERPSTETADADADAGADGYGEVLVADWRDRLIRRAHPHDDSVVFTAATPPAAQHRSPVILLHGVGNDGGTFGPIIPSLAEQRRVIAPHLNPELFSIDDDPAAAVAGLVVFLEALAPPPWRLVGHSMGGVLAGLLMRARPDLVAGAVLLNAPLPGVSHRFRTGDTFDRTGRALLQLKALAQVTALGRPRLPGLLAGVEVAVVRNALRSFVADAGRLDGDVIRGAVVEARTRDADRFIRLARKLPDWELEPFGSVPVTIVVGADDPLLPADDLARVAAGYPDATIEVLDGVGHFAQLEMPRATVDAIEAAFANRRRSLVRSADGRRGSKRRLARPAWTRRRGG